MRIGVGGVERAVHIDIRALDSTLARSVDAVPAIAIDQQLVGRPVEELPAAVGRTAGRPSCSTTPTEPKRRFPHPRPAA
jgi:hypothetical protein